MKNIIRNFGYQLKILNSLYCLVFLTFFIDLSVIVVIKHVISQPGLLNLSLLFVLAALRVALYGGSYGIITEIISGQELFFKFKRFKQNIKDNWIFSVLLIVFILILYFIALINNAVSNTSLLSFFSYFDIVFCLGVGYLIMNKKYTFVRIEKIHFDAQLLFSMLLVYFVKIVLAYLLSNWNEGSTLVYKLIALTSQYLHFLLFVNIAMQLNKNCSSEFHRNETPELYLINPVMPGVLLPIEHAFIGNWYCFYPPAFVVIGALTPKKYKIREFYNIFWDDRYFKKGKLVAITCCTSNAHEAYRIAKGFKEKGSTVVMGGAHVTFVPDEALEYCDSVVIGEAVGVWEEVINDYEKGNMKKKYYGMDHLEYPESVHNTLMSLDNEIIPQFMQTTRGCKFNCDFCSTPVLCGPTIRKWPVENMVALINKVRRKNKRILFLDDNIYADPKYYFELFEEIKKLKIKWIALSSLDIAKNDKALTLAKESGCEMLRFGYEISDQSEEKRHGGKLSLANEYRSLTRKVRSKGIHITAFLLFGFNSDNFKSLVNLIKFALVNPFLINLIMVITPFPGTMLFNKKVAANKMRNLNWMNYDTQHFVFKHDNINEAVYENALRVIGTILFYRPLAYVFLSVVFVWLAYVIFLGT